MCVEHAGPRPCGLFGAIVNSGSAPGLILSNLVFIAAAALAGPEFVAWGWRMPFLVSAILIVLGLAVDSRSRRSLNSSRCRMAVPAGTARRGSPVGSTRAGRRKASHRPTPTTSPPSRAARGPRMWATAMGPLTLEFLQSSVRYAAAHGGGWVPLVFHMICRPFRTQLPELHGLRRPDRLRGVLQLPRLVAQRAPPGTVVKTVKEATTQP